MRQWVVSFPIPLRYLFASQPQLLSPVLQVIHLALSTFVITQAGLTHAQAQTVPAPTNEELQTVLMRIITRVMKVLARQGALIEEHTRAATWPTPMAIRLWLPCTQRPAPTALPSGPGRGRKY